MARPWWRGGGVVAWTERDGHGRPPAGPHRALTVSLAVSLGVVFVGMIATDALCPDHRALVQTLATLSLIGAACAIIGLVRGWASAPWMVLGVSAIGVAIGFIDAAHDPTRGRIIALAFGLVTLGSVWLAWRATTVVRWQRRIAMERAGEPTLAATAWQTTSPAAPSESATEEQSRLTT